MQLSSGIKFLEFFIGILKLLTHWRIKIVEVEDGQIFIANTLGLRRKKWIIRLYNASTYTGRANVSFVLVSLGGQVWP